MDQQPVQLDLPLVALQVKDLEEQVHLRRVLLSDLAAGQEKREEYSLGLEAKEELGAVMPSQEEVVDGLLARRVK